MGEIVTILSQKGGVGKTTTAVNLSASLALLNQKILLIDLDPQGHISASFGYAKYDIKGSIDEAIFESKDIMDLIHKTPIDNFDFIPYVNEIGDREHDCFIAPLNEAKLKKILSGLKSHYDFIFIDNPPTLNNITSHALIASDSVLVPIQCEFYALKALGSLLKEIKIIKTNYNPDLSYRGFLLTMVDLRNNLSKRVVTKVRQTLKELVYETMIPRNIRLAEVPYYGKPAYYIDKSAKGSTSYLDLAREFLSQNGTIASKLATNKHLSDVSRMAN
ncbi:ParA family protein [candidate division KSB1 bacterium]|nr:ParA family protein [candidate division KSB1 bacterium]